MSLASTLAKAARSLVRVPGIAAALASLALGIGATSAVLTLAESLLYSGAPGVSEPRRLAGVHMAASPGNPYGGNSYLNVLDLRALSRTFEGLAAYCPVTLSLVREDGAEPISAEAVSGDYFGLLGATPLEGRLLRPEDDRPGAEPAVVVSHAFWRNRLGRNRDLEATRLILNGTRFTVVGIAPEGFRGPSFHGRAEVWVPLGALPRVASGVVPADILRDRGAQWLSAVGRLRPGISPSQAQSELETIRRRLEREIGTAAWGRPMTVTDWREVALGRNRSGSGRLIGILAVCSLLILIIACGNVAHLLAGRALVRRGEVALRLALGARRGRAALPLAAECLLLGVGAYGGSLVVQHLLLKILLKLGFPLMGFDVRWSPGSLVLALGVAAGATVLFGLWPVLSVSRQSLMDVMKSPGLRTIGPRRFPAGKALVTLEAALSMMILVATLLVLASARNVLAIDPGFDSEGVAYAFVDLGAKKYSSEQADAFYGALLEGLRRDRGITAASLTTFLPFEGSLSWTVYRPGSEGAGETSPLGLDIVDQGSFEAMGIPILRGRDFRSEDIANGAVIVNQAMARTLWPGEEALGRSISLDSPEGELLEVIGIAGDARYSSPTEPPAPHFYLYRRYRDHAGLTAAFSSNLWLLVRAEGGDPRGLLPRVREAVRSIDPELPVPRLGILEDHVRGFTARSRYTAVLLGLLGGAGLLLAAGGVYAVVLSSLLARQHEIAVRMALGASPRAILRMALTEAGLLSAAGILLGAVAAYLLARLVETQLYGISAREPLAFAAAAAVLSAVSLTGSLLPARKAAQVDSAFLLKELE